MDTSALCVHFMQTVIRTVNDLQTK